jgi:UDP-N-acetylglucosamine:LPS N-acetylglucosamine transferase
MGLLGQPERLAAMRAQAQAVGRPNAAMDIARYIMTDLEK